MSSLYLGSALALTEFLSQKSPLTAIIYEKTQINEKQKKAAYALTLGVLRYKHVLDEVLNASQLMKADRHMNRALVLVQLYDLLIGAKSIQGGGGVKKIILQHENKLRSAFARLKVSVGARDDDELLPREIRFTARLPRFARVNTIRSTVEEVSHQLKSEGYILSPTAFDHRGVTWPAGSEMHFYLDAHIPNLLVFHPATDLHEHRLLKSGALILQDKASCMTAAALAPNPSGQEDAPYHMLDACAAPGNKTTHLLAIAMEHIRKNAPNKLIDMKATTSTAAPHGKGAAGAPHKRSRAPVSEDDENGLSTLTSNRATGQTVSFHIGMSDPSTKPLLKLEACEVDPTRFQLLQRMMVRALPPHRLASGNLTNTAVLPEAPPSGELAPCPPAIVTVRNQSFLDLDPHSPEVSTVRAILLDPTCSGSGMGHRIEQFYKHRVVDDSPPTGGKKSLACLHTRLLSAGHEKAEVMENVSHLAAFQKTILSHALSFPNVELVAYSTCSIHSAEDEAVVEHVLQQHTEFELQTALPTWHRRGDNADTQQLTPSQAARLVRSAGAEDGMNGFFVAKFVRRSRSTARPDVNKATSAAPTNANQASSAANKNAAAGQKRAREEETEEAESEEDADGDGVDAPSLGKQTLRNRKKREKKAKKRKLAAAANQVATQ